MNTLALYRPVYAPAGIAVSDGADALAAAWARTTQGVQTAADDQIRRAAETALDSVQARTPALAAQIRGEIAVAVQQTAMTVQSTASAVVADAFRQAAAALIAAQPSLEAAVRRIAAQGGQSATEAGLSTAVRKVAPYAIGAVVVGALAWWIVASTSER